jgi:hypothetical protein
MTVTSRWTVRHGDTSRSEVWAVLDENGDELNLTGWKVLAQARENAESDAVIAEWTRDHGVTIGTATIRLRSGRKVETSTVRLYLEPADFEYLPRRWSGVFDVEISLPALDPEDPPQRRYTIVDDGHLVIEPDVSRS